MAGGTALRRAEIGQERREKTRQKLIAAAARVIATSGDKNATIDDFIQAAGVARGTFYNYFPTREDLLDALWTQVGKDPFLEIRNACAAIDDPAERLIAQAYLVLNRSGEDQVWGWLVFALSGNAETVNADLRAYPVPDLEAGLRTGRLSYDTLDSARDLVVGTIRAGMKTQLSGRGSSEYARALCKMILLALAVPSAEVDSILSSLS
ncbi:MAG: TetR/AcrR family transcriptional regulator [Parvibaculaceae bacterium]|nr:TetR/AcrR family transcriptional regulator [Parvibaculaceae bacterium]